MVSYLALLLMVSLLAAVLLFFFLRGVFKALTRTPPAPLPLQPGEPAPVSTVSMSQKVIAVTYVLGGAIAAIMTLPQLNGLSLDFLGALAWLFLLSQIGVAVYGGWQYWAGQPLGAQLLYWLSWSCVPVITSSTVSYWSGFGIAFMPTLTLGPGIGMHFNVYFGYESQLWLNSGEYGLTLGLNLAALLFASLIAQSMKVANVRRWPLIRPTGMTA